MTRVAVHKRNFGLVFQSYALFPHLSVYDNVAFGLRTRKMDRETIDKKVKDILEVCGLTEFAQRFPKQMSGGQRQRVAIARALANEPPLILADEPTGNLDTASSIEIMELFRQLHKEGATVVVVTHEEDIAAFADRVIRFSDGQVQSDTLNTHHPGGGPDDRVEDMLKVEDILKEEAEDAD